MVDPNAEGERRPSGPPSNVVDVLHRLRERNLPARVDANYLVAAGISENLVSQARFGLQFLGFVDELGQPSDALRTLARATDEDYQQILNAAIRRAYSDVFELIDPSSDDRARVRNVFRRYAPASQQDRMVMFFLAMCREAGVAVLDAPRKRTSAVAPIKKRVAAATRTTSPGNSRVSSTQADASAPIAAGRVPHGLRLLLELLPPEGSPLPPAKREQWLTLAREALKFAYPEDLSGEPSADPKDEPTER